MERNLSMNNNQMSQMQNQMRMPIMPTPTPSTMPTPMPSQMAPQMQMQQSQADFDSMVEEAEDFRIVYPELFYKLQPYIMMICDQMDTYGTAMPSQDLVDQMSDIIYEDIVEMYPELAEYVRESEQNNTESVPTQRFGSFPPRRRRREFRRRGVLRDLIDILLYSELFRRRRRFF